MLYLAGEDRSGDLAGELAAAGIEVATRVVYRAVALPTFPPDVREALTAGWLDGVLHFSRRSAETYLDCAAAAGVTRAGAGADALLPVAAGRRAADGGRRPRHPRRRRRRPRPP